MKIGEIVAASVIDGLVAKLQLGNPEELKIAFPVIVEGARYDFYCLVEDVLNEESDIADQLAGSTIADVIVPRPETHEGYGGPIFYSKAKLRMIQLVDRQTKKLSEPQTIPPYFSSCRHATRDDVERIYEVTDTSATLGTITGVEPFHVQLDMKKLVEKPFAIFGRTGTGKSILNKLVCAGILSKDVGSVLIFDMHSEYGVFSATDKTEGLKFFFPGKVEIFSLDPKNREAKPFVLDTGEITPEDLIVALQDLTAPMVDTLYEIAKSRGGRDLISAVKDATMEMLGSERAHEMTLQGLKRRIGRLDRLPFLKAMTQAKDAFAYILGAIRDGKSVVLDFGTTGRTRWSTCSSRTSSPAVCSSCTRSGTRSTRGSCCSSRRPTSSSVPRSRPTRTLSAAWPAKRGSSISSWPSSTSDRPASPTRCAVSSRTVS